MKKTIGVRENMHTKQPNIIIIAKILFVIQLVCTVGGMSLLMLFAGVHLDNTLPTPTCPEGVDPFYMDRDTVHLCTAERLAYIPAWTIPLGTNLCLAALACAALILLIRVIDCKEGTGQLRILFRRSLLVIGAALFLGLLSLGLPASDFLAGTVLPTLLFLIWIGIPEKLDISQKLLLLLQFAAAIGLPVVVLQLRNDLGNSNTFMPGPLSLETSRVYVMERLTGLLTEKSVWMLVCSAGVLLGWVGNRLAGRRLLEKGNAEQSILGFRVSAWIFGMTLLMFLCIATPPTCYLIWFWGH